MADEWVVRETDDAVYEKLLSVLGIVCTDHHTDEGAPAVAGIVPHCVPGRLRRLVGEAGVRVCSSRLFLNSSSMRS